MHKRFFIRTGLQRDAIEVCTQLNEPSVPVLFEQLGYAIHGHVRDGKTMSVFQHRGNMARMQTDNRKGLTHSYDRSELIVAVGSRRNGQQLPGESMCKGPLHNANLRKFSGMNKSAISVHEEEYLQVPRRRLFAPEMDKHQAEERGDLEPGAVEGDGDLFLTMAANTQ